MVKSKVILRSVKTGKIQEVIKEIMSMCEWEDIIPKNGKVYVKPNLCTDEIDKVESANTSAELLEAVCRVLLESTQHISICESDGARYTAESAYKNTGYDRIVRELGLNWVNLSKRESVSIGHPIFDRYQTKLPKELLEADALINMPVIKTHALTVFTGSIKNLWGCVPRYDRIWLHKYLDELLSDLIFILKPAINIMDGIVGAEGRGPTNGIPRRMDVVMASTDPVALDATSMRLVGLDPYTSKHILLSHTKGYGNIDERGIDVDGDFEGLKVEFIPPVLDFAVSSMNYMTRYRWFLKYILFNDTIFRNTRSLVVLLRRIGILNDTPQKPSRLECG